MTMTKAETTTRLARRTAAHQKRVEKAMAPTGPKRRLRPVRLSGKSHPPYCCGAEMKLYSETEDERNWFCSTCQTSKDRPKRLPKAGFLAPPLGRGQTGRKPPDENGWQARDQGSWHGR